MAQSLSAVYVHLVFSTKERRPFLCDEQIRQSLHAYLGAISKQLGCTGGIEDHVHHLARFSRTITQAEWVKELKRVSNLWLKETWRIREFEWQGGYADFSVSASNLERVRKYILNQAEHHKKISFKRSCVRYCSDTASSTTNAICGTERERGRNPDGVAINTCRLPNVAAKPATLGFGSQSLRD